MLVQPGRSPLTPMVSSAEPGGGVRSMEPQLESSKSVWAQAMSSPVRNFQGPGSSTEDSPSLTVGWQRRCRAGVGRVVRGRCSLRARSDRCQQDQQRPTPTAHSNSQSEEIQSFRKGPASDCTPRRSCSIRDLPVRNCIAPAGDCHSKRKRTLRWRKVLSFSHGSTCG